jgi:HEAT repeat protein
MTTRRRSGVLALLAVGGGLGLLALLGLLATQDGEQTPARADAHRARALQWRAGSTQSYAVALDSTVRMIDGAPESQSIRVRLLGVLEFRTLQVDTAGVLVGMRLSSVESWVGEERRADMESAFGRPFRVRYTPAGLPTAFEFSRDVTTKHRGVLAKFVRTFQVSMRSDERWVAEEPHASGAYEAAYVSTAPSRWDKTKLRYIGDGTARDGALPVLASTESFRVESGRDWIAAMTVRETVDSKDQSGMAVSVTNHATLELLPESMAPDARSATDWSFVAGPATAAAQERPAAPVLSREEGMAELRRSVAGLNAAVDGRSEWIHGLRDLLVADPDLASVLLDTMRNQELTDRARADLYLVFELAGTPESQAVLAAVMQDRDSRPSDGLRAIVALGGVAHPTAASVDALWRTTRTDRERLASTAALALGSVGGTLRTAKDARYASLRADLLAAARGTQTSARRVTFVLALGNTHDASLAREVVPLLDDANPRVRSAVARAAGRLGTNEVADELMDRFEQEKNSVVRASLAGALVGWESPPPSALESIRAAILSERDETARFQLVRMLSGNLEGFPENRDCLRGHLRTERSPRIRRTIAEALAVSKAK